MSTSEAATRFSRAALHLKGLSGAGFDATVQPVLAAAPDVAQAKVNGDLAEVVFSGEDPNSLVDVLENAGLDGQLESVEPVHPPPPQLARFRVGGMTCSSCSSSVETALAALPGVQHAAVSLTLQEARVEFDSSLATEEELLQAIVDAGFDGKSLGRGDSATLLLAISGMVCSSCVAAAEEALTRQEGVVEAKVNLLAARAEVRYDPNKVGPRRLIQALSEAGYEADPLDDEHVDGAALREKEKRDWRRKFLVSMLFSLPLFLMTMVLMYIPGVKEGLETHVGGFPLIQILSFSLTTPVQFWIGWSFHVGAYKALRCGRANMDVLVSVGTNAAYAYSIISIIYSRFKSEYDPHGMFFETSALLITFICLGKYLESAAKGKTSQAISELLKLAPATAILCVQDSSRRVVREEEVAAVLIQRGDLLKVLPGARVPADGEVVEGQSYVDESMVTGEPAPVSKKAGGEVITGTINCGGVLRIKALRVGRDTTLSQIVKLVESAQMSKAPIQAFADRLSAVFVPIVILLAFVTWLAWYLAGVTGSYPSDWLPMGSTALLFALLFGIAVVVIACPCALGLATPTAIMVGTGVAASNGILIKSAEALETVHKLKVVVFDKTGTLTEGHPSMVDWKILDDRGLIFPHSSLWPLDRVLFLAASTETGSEHPLAKAVLSYAALHLDDSLATAPDSPASIDSGDENVDSKRLISSRRPLLPSKDTRRKARYLQEQTRELQNVGWLAPAKDTEVVSGRGVKCRVAVPAHIAATLPLTTLARHGSQALSSRSPSLSSHRLAGSHASLRASTPHTSSQDNSMLLPSTAASAPPAAGVTGGLEAGCVEVRVVMGNRKLMQEDGVTLPPQVGEYMREWEGQGMTCVLMAVEGTLLAVFAITDPVKPEAPGVIAALQRLGLQCHMVTGDCWTTARSIAAKVGIVHVSAEVLPAGKAEQVKQLQEGGRTRVAMVGDGVNDSPALAMADVGMAIGSGTQVAVEAADYVLMKSDLEDVLISIDLSKRTFHRIQLNYLWALGYNVLMIPIAAGALYPPLHWQLPPWLAGAAMAMSSVSVVCSSLLLRRYKPPSPVMTQCTVLSM